MRFGGKTYQTYSWIDGGNCGVWEWVIKITSRLLAWVSSCKFTFCFCKMGNISRVSFLRENKSSFWNDHLEKPIRCSSPREMSVVEILPRGLSIIVWSATQSCLTLCDPMECSLTSSSVHGIFQVRILEWVAMPSSRGIFPTSGLNPHLLYLLHW